MFSVCFLTFFNIFFYILTHVSVFSVYLPVFTKPFLPFSDSSVLDIILFPCFCTLDYLDMVACRWSDLWWVPVPEFDSHFGFVYLTTLDQKR